MDAWLLSDVPRRSLGSLKWSFARGNELPMWVADMDFPCPPSVVEALGQRVEAGYFAYAVDTGSLADAFAAWCRDRQGWDPLSGTLRVASGVLPVMTAAVAAMTRPGDGVLVMPPVYGPFLSIPATMGRRVVEAPLSRNGEDGVWGMDFSALKEVMDASKPRLLFLCSPHNPVGRVWSSRELQTLAGLCRERGIGVVADEIHGDVMAVGQKFLSVAGLCGEGGFDPDSTVVIQAPSKTFNIPGAGCGMYWSRNPGPAGLVAKALGDLGLATVNVLSMTAAGAAYAGGGPWLDKVLSLINENDAALRKWAFGHGHLLPAPREGTFLAWLDAAGLRGRMEDPDGNIAHYIRTRTGVFLSPGHQFGTGGRDWVRMNLACAPALLQEALARLDGVL